MTTLSSPPAGIGTIVAVMLPYSMVFLIGWTVLFAIWMALGWPIGPGSPPEYIPAAAPAAALAP